jgi:hypothetical protein
MMMLYCIIIVGVNGLLIDRFDKIISYKTSTITNLPFWVLLLYTFIGILMFPFYKTFKRMNRVNYMKKIINDYERFPFPTYEDEYKVCVRELKLIKIKKNIKQS